MVLIVLCAHHAAQPVKPVNEVNKAFHIPSHLSQAAPFLECKHGGPDIPEISLKKIVVKPVFNPLVS
jgi:hypothetical protein